MDSIVEDSDEASDENQLASDEQPELNSENPVRITVLTGAGISAESGIKTFRDHDGLWENHRIEDVFQQLHRRPTMHTSPRISAVSAKMVI